MGNKTSTQRDSMYRPEIDGLRAIAVVAVVLYHAEFTLFGVNPFRGGFIGVDVFFVISGYLITGIILKGIAADRFTYSNFYERRARRILPALFAVMAASIPFALALMEPKALMEFAGSGLSSLFYSSNVWFWLEDSYTAEPSALKPFLHTWSLSVEEQFYFVFPITLILIWRFARSHMLAIFVLLFLFSLELAQVGSGLFVDAAFFLLPTRGWELLAGAILAKIEIDKGRTGNPVLNAVMSALGLFLIAHAIVFFNDQMRHPSYTTLWPVAGAMLLIWFCKPGELVSKLLSSKPMVGIGLISYSLYLWHFPIFAFARIAEFDSFSDRLIQIALSVLLAVATYFFIEKPTRDSSITSTRFVVRFLLLVFFSLSVTFGYLYYQSSKSRSEFVVSGGEFDIGKEKAKRHEYSKRVCRDIGRALCKRPQSGMRNVLVIGDSMVPDAINIMSGLYPNTHFIADSLGGCPPHADIATLVSVGHPELLACQQLNINRFSSASLEHIDVVAIANLYGWYGPDDLVGYLEFLKSNGMNNVIVFGNYFQLNMEFPDAITLFGRSGLEDGSSGLFDDIVKSAFIYESELRKVVESSGFVYISIQEAACDNSKCPLFVKGVPFTWDRFHLSLEFSQSLAPQFRQQMGNQISK